MIYTGSEIIIKLLKRQGITTVAGIPGGANLPLYDALGKSSIRHILARHEQGAGFIAQGMARVSGKAAVCLGTSGPGATNLLTAISDAKLDSIPLIAITGQVPSGMIGTDAFQEVDTYGLTLPITKHNFLVRRAEELLDVIPRAFKIAESGRPGPVVIDVPKDVQLEEISLIDWPDPGIPDSPMIASDDLIDRLADMIHRAERPILYIGGGIIASGASNSLRAVARKNSIPVTSTLMGLGAFPKGDPLSLEMLGMHGAPFTNILIEDADLLIAAGVRFDDRATGRVAEFCKHARIAHIDIDPSEIDKIKPSNLAICGDVGNVMDRLLNRLIYANRSDWIDHVTKIKQEHPLPLPDVSNSLHPMIIIKTVGNLCSEDTIVTTDVGQHQMWTAQVYPFSEPRTFLTSGGLGTMGFGLPAAIGAALELTGKPVICISGDGSILMNIQELATLAELNLQVKIILMNNNSLGLVRQQQELFYSKRYHASLFEKEPDFCAIAEGFGIPAVNLINNDCCEATIEKALNTPGPAFINVPIDANKLVLPMVPPGGANHEMISEKEALI